MLRHATDVTAYREELENIKVRGKDCPRPIKAWAQCGCSKRVMQSLARCVSCHAGTRKVRVESCSY